MSPIKTGVRYNRPDESCFHDPFKLGEMHDIAIFPSDVFLYQDIPNLERKSSLGNEESIWDISRSFIKEFIFQRIGYKV